MVLIGTLRSRAMDQERNKEGSENSEMRIDLGLPRGDRQHYFVDNLNAAIRTLTSSSSGSAGLGHDGLFRSTVTGPFLIDAIQVPLSWELVKASDGRLLHLDVMCTDPSIPEARWKTPAYEIVTSVLAAALSERRRPFFMRSMFFYIGPQLDGEYWLPGYRFAPALPDDSEPYLINAERVVTIDMAVEAVDIQNAMVLAGEAARRHAARLSLLLNVGLYRAQAEFRWVMPVGEGRVGESVRYQTAFSRPYPAVGAMPKKGELCPLGQYQGSLTERYRVAGHLLSLPRQARMIMKGIDLAEPWVADAFDRGARLYQVASVVGTQFPSVGLAYRIAAVEAIARANPEMSSFSEFMRKYISSTAVVDELLEYMYGPVRSGHFHAGEFPMGEFSRMGFFDPLMDPEDAELTRIHFACFELTREAIVNWMVSFLPSGTSDDDEPPPDAAANGTDNHNPKSPGKP
jgi:hypothetical protein